MTANRLTRRTFLVGVGAAVGAAALADLGSGQTVAAQAGGRTVRIGIRLDGALERPSAQLSCEGPFAVQAASGEGDALKIDPLQQVTLTSEGDGVRAKAGDKSLLFPGPAQLIPADPATPVLEVVGTKGYPYRGRFEVRAGGPGTVVLVNVVDLDQYVLGVVAKEVPASFGIEPLRAQAIAARSYVLARRASGTHKELGVDTCDSQHCQVYAGMTGEHPLGNGAVERTRGMILLRGGKVFEPLYSSACGGHTEAVGRLFGGDDEEAVADGELPSGIDLGSDAGASVFYKGAWDSNCAGSNRYRWSYTWSREELQATFGAGLRRLVGSASAPPGGAEGIVAGLSGISVAARGLSGRALSLRLEGGGAEWTIKSGDWGIRNLLRTPDGDTLPSSAFSLEQARGADGKVSQLTVHGAGWGHGGGMCQWGTRGLAARGLAYDAILGHYYPSADLAKAPS